MKWLQWGRRLSTAEIGQALNLRFGWEVASMGPPSLNGGNDVAAADRELRADASMGPPSLNGGNLDDDRRRDGGDDASMGPPSLNGGNREA